MSRVLHVLDRTCGWEQRIAVTQLALAASADAPARAVSLGDPPAGFDPVIPVEVIGCHRRAPFLSAPALRRPLAADHIEILHAWGPDALAAGAAAADPSCQLVTTVFDPAIPDDHVKLLRTVGAERRLAVICAAERVRRRLVERGVPYACGVVVRPAVDFAIIKAVDVKALRASLGIPIEARWFVIPPPMPGRDGHWAALWAVIMRRCLDEPVRLTVPGGGPQIDELKALAAASAYGDVVTFCGATPRFEALCVAADDLLLGDVDEIPMTAAAWAMAGNTLISAPATYAISEIIANDLNGKLFKAPKGWRRRAAKLAARLDHAPDAAKIRDVARGQAYEVFSRRRFVQQTEKVYANVLDDTVPASGISDPALVGAAELPITD